MYNLDKSQIKIISCRWNSFFMAAFVLSWKRMTSVLFSQEWNKYINAHQFSIHGEEKQKMKHRLPRMHRQSTRVTRKGPDVTWIIAQIWVFSEGNGKRAHTHYAIMSVSSSILNHYSYFSLFKKLQECLQFCYVCFQEADKMTKYLNKQEMILHVTVFLLMRINDVSKTFSLHCKP